MEDDGKFQAAADLPPGNTRVNMEQEGVWAQKPGGMVFDDRNFLPLAEFELRTVQIEFKILLSTFKLNLRAEWEEICKHFGIKRKGTADRS